MKSNKQIVVHLRNQTYRCLVSHGNHKQITKEIKHTLKTRLMKDSSVNASCACLPLEPPSSK